MARSQEQYLLDIDEAISDARSFAEGHDLEDFLKDRQLRYAIERALEIIGEATSNLSKEVKERDPSLPDRLVKESRAVTYSRPSEWASLRRKFFRSFGLPLVRPVSFGLFGTMRFLSLKGP